MCIKLQFELDKHQKFLPLSTSHTNKFFPSDRMHTTLLYLFERRNRSVESNCQVYWH